MSGAVGSPLASPSATRDALERYGLATKHRLGQNFLVDNHVIERIMSLARLSAESRVLEVGPGIGTLTLALVEAAGAVVSIEADAELEPVLADHAAYHDNFAFIMGDALKVECGQVEAAFGVLGAEPASPDAFVANLPYNVAATLVLDYLERYPSLLSCTVMVQKEVADRISAAPGSKTYGAYTAKLGLFGRVAGRFEVPPRCFMPAPHVDSAVVRIERLTAAGAPGVGVGESGAGAAEAAGSGAEVDLAAAASDPGCALQAVVSDPARRTYCMRAIDAAFAQRRKTIRNSMGASGFDKTLLDRAFAETGISPTCRAETLSTADFARLACSLAAGEGAWA